jgi:excisionase family DNA binding protein
MVTVNFSGRSPAGNFLEVAEIWLESRSAIRYLVLSCFITESKEAVTDMEPQDKWLTIEELSGYLKMSRSKLYQMAQKGELPGSKIGTQWRFDRDEVDDWMKSLRQTAPQKASANNG